jgi:VanZ family protein
MAFIKTYYKSIIWGILIVFLLFTPGDKFPETKILNFKGADKLIHIILFMVFQFILFFEASKVVPSMKLKRIALLISITVLFAISTEIIQQSIIRKRTGSIFDLLADIIGIIVAYFLFIKFRSLTDRSFHPIS